VTRGATDRRSLAASDLQHMKTALRLAQRGYGLTSPNPMVGAVLVQNGKVIGRGWHRKAGGPHAEIEALRDAERREEPVKGATLHVTLEPCCTHGRTPPCTDAILSAGIRRVVVGAVDPNPKHAGNGLQILKRAHIQVTAGVHADACAELNEAFNHWIVRKTPLVTVKAAMTLDGKIATADGDSKWITGSEARARGMRLRQGNDAILVGINTVLLDDPSLTFRPADASIAPREKNLRRIILDSRARCPLTARVINDTAAALTTIVVGPQAPERRVNALSRSVNVLQAPSGAHGNGIDLGWLLKTLGSQEVTSLLVEGGGEVNASFLLGGWAHRVAFFYAPKILGGRNARKSVAGDGARSLEEALALGDVQWTQVGADLMMRARVLPRRAIVG
jgi:diaminohydroxyphosphoribosylaminopyrimidine deaminase/5-amino-6-(5-phosphoribosylamino)uracil reductase